MGKTSPIAVVGKFLSIWSRFGRGIIMRNAAAENVLEITA